MTPPAPGGRQGGFTLVEMLVVLAIVAILGAVAYTAGMPVYARTRLAYQREDVERQLLALPQRVRQSGHGGVLADRSGDNLPDGTAVPIEGKLDSVNALEQWRLLRFAVPAGWRLVVPHPVFYHFSGACEGGTVAFAVGGETLRYVLTAPLCRPIRADASASG